MRHPDEGTIHAWLDGALSADEAAQVEAHVKDCPQCQAAVAEARGFIAASSRILTALDDAPRAVIPAAAPRRRVQPWMWRVAATVLVVAGGTLLLFRDRGGWRRGEYGTGAARVESRQSNTGSAAALPTPDSAAGRGAVVQRAPGVSLAPPQSRSATALSFTPSPSRDDIARNPGAPGAEPARADPRTTPTARLRAESTAPATAPAPTPAPAGAADTSAMSRSPTVATMDFAASAAPRVVETKRVVGRTQTFYEIAPGDTVVLEEQFSAELNEVVVTGAAGRIVADNQRALSKPARPAGKAAPMAARPAPEAPPVAEPQMQTTAAMAPSVAGAAEPRDAQRTEIRRISWLDPSTGRVLVLSGRHSQEELQEIRRRIQRLRDNAAPSNRNPE